MIHCGDSQLRRPDILNTGQFTDNSGRDANVIALYLLAAIAVIGFAADRLFFYPRRRQSDIISQAFPDEWRKQLERDMVHYTRLPQDLRKKLEDGVLLLLDRVSFYGCNGVEVTDAMKRLIAAHGALLTCGMRTGYDSGIRTILVYPDGYRAPSHTAEGMVHTTTSDARLGESWGDGRVVLAWSTLKQEAADPQATSNLAIHEFAHQLDTLDGQADGAPPLSSGEQARNWEAVFSESWERLKAAPTNPHNVLDPYGATNPAEFFAVATEAFFQSPQALQTHEPHLYDCLKGFYQLSPADWGKQT
ncbi:MAG: hypothetical protein CL581_11510 [Alteromonadaceae bacterium]|nr:hypothetical protein [Alteromonadaceae bacterium]MBH85058.1 hypothetical protein [Alteromonadaceae bacterium]